MRMSERITCAKFQKISFFKKYNFRTRVCWNRGAFLTFKFKYFHCPSIFTSSKWDFFSEFIFNLMTHWKNFLSFLSLSYQVRICVLWIGCSIRIILISQWLVERMNSKPARRAHSTNRKIYFTQLLWGEN